MKTKIHICKFDLNDSNEEDNSYSSQQIEQNFKMNDNKNSILKKYTKNFILEEYDFIPEEEIEQEEQEEKYIPENQYDETKKNQDDIHFKYELEKLSDFENLKSNKEMKYNDKENKQLTKVNNKIN